MSLIEEQPAGPRHLFRGQSDASWKLVPGLYRLPSPNISAKSLDESYSLYEAQLIDFFFREAFPYLPRVERGYSNDRIIAQHFGVPTRLLDWSSDPFVALFFALESWERDEDAAIYMLLPDARYLPEHVSGLGLHKAIAFTPLALDRRVPAQKSVFTFHPYGPDSARFVPLDDREDFGNKLAGTNGISSNGFLKIVVPQARKRVLFQDLLQKGVDRRNLFPGLDGVGSDIAQRAKCGQVW
ncbi:FRG domain-containing protein [Tabrizicola sp.]|uniref:FRG domain-containing protein n=1 Tax=Tabrizicola sp. TaxID=2005166 RepID=UPI00286CA526|nr:FRG domain-containing protein [Tabrizicola sp.]